MAAPRTAVFRFDAAAAIGGGHAYRCLTLADGLAEAGWRIMVAGRPETFATVPAAARFPHLVLEGSEEAEAEALGAFAGPAELLVVDHYRRDAAFETAARAWARRILVIDDLADRRHDCDLLLDQTHGRRPEDYAPVTPQGCRMLLGARFALLRPQFAAARPAALARRGAGRVDRILVSLGTTDPDNLTGRALDAVAASGLSAAVDVVLGPTAPHLASVRQQAAALDGVRVLTGVADMAGLMAAADLAIGAGGTTSWERCCLGLPTLVVVTADNQSLIAQALAADGAVRVAGWHRDLSAADIAAALGDLAGSAGALRAMSAAAAAICDGEGVRRVVAEVTR